MIRSELDAALALPRYARRSIGVKGSPLPELPAIGTAAEPGR